MNSITIIPFALILFFLSACNEAEQLVPATMDQQFSLEIAPDQQVISTYQGQPGDMTTNFAREGLPCGHKGLLIDRTDQGCGPLIRHDDGREFEVIADYLASGNQKRVQEIVFGFIERPDLHTPCKTHPVIELTCFRYMSQVNAGSKQTPSNQISTH